MTTWFRKQLDRIGVVSAEADALAADANTPPVSVLLVDDMPDNLQVLMETLKPLGHKLLAAKDGETALAVARRANPALILLDVMMPGMDGYEVCRRLKADPVLAQSAVIFCSALEDTADKVRGLALGAVDFVTKPFEPEEIVARVGTHLAVQQLARNLAVRNRQLTRELAVAQTGKADALRRLDWAFAGTSTALMQLKADLAVAAAAAATPVLLRSLPACGAELAARVIHASSPRAGGAFILVDGAPLRATTAFEAPAFALGGAEPSRLELADGGTLCIDHADRLDGAALDQLAAYVAARGEGRADVPDVRLVAITSRLTGAPLPERFPAQLEQELTLNLIVLPTLADRCDDIVPMAEALLQRQGHALGHRLRAFDGISRKRLTSHDWPGNLRELEDVVARSAAAAPAEATITNVDSGLLAGGIALGSYRLIRKLGAGGYGEVWEARHQLLARPAAVKLILDDAAETDAVERFRLEATATASLGSPHTVTLYDFGVSEQGQFYYVMELLDGLDLYQLADAHGVLPPARLAHFLVHACRSLAEAHARGMIHRDLKPSNLFACRLGLEVDVLKILDFGLVRKTGGQVPSRLTQQGVIIGTPEYMPPETATGEGEQDGRTDMYSLAATAYRLLAGRPVFEGSTPMQILLHHIRTPPEALTKVAPGTPKAFSDLIMSALAKERADRPDALAFLDALLTSGLPQQWTERDREAWWQHHRPT